METPTIEEIDTFLSLVETARVFNATKLKKGITEEKLRKAIQPATIDWLVSQHLISIHPKRDVWIAWKNTIYPNNTIDNLTKWNEERRVL